MGVSAGTVKTHLLKLRDEIVARAKHISAVERYVAASLPCNVYAKNLRITTIALYSLFAVWTLILTMQTNYLLCMCVRNTYAAECLFMVKFNPIIKV